MLACILIPIWCHLRRPVVSTADRECNLLDFLLVSWISPRSPSKMVFKSTFNVAKCLWGHCRTPRHFLSKSEGRDWLVHIFNGTLWWTMANRRTWHGIKGECSLDSDKILYKPFHKMYSPTSKLNQQEFKQEQRRLADRVVLLVDGK